MDYLFSVVEYWTDAEFNSNNKLHLQWSNFFHKNFLDNGYIIFCNLRVFYFIISFCNIYLRRWKGLIVIKCFCNYYICVGFCWAGWSCRSSRPKVFCKKVILNFLKKSFSTLLKKNLWQRCFPVNFEKFFRTSPLAASEAEVDFEIYFSFFFSDVYIYPHNL